MSHRIATALPMFEKGKRRRARVRPVAEGQRRPRVRDRKHLASVAALPCLVSGAPGPSICAHVRYGEAAAGKPHTGMAEKPDDKWTVPLCPELHTDHAAAQHRYGERDWWARLGVDPVAVCEELYRCSGNLPAMEEVIARHAPRSFEEKLNGIA